MATSMGRKTTKKKTEKKSIEEKKLLEVKRTLFQERKSIYWHMSSFSQRYQVTKCQFFEFIWMKCEHFSQTILNLFFHVL